MSGLEIKQVRDKCGMSQQAFATLIGVSIASVSAWEQGKRTISPRMAEIVNSVCGSKK